MKSPLKVLLALPLAIGLESGPLRGDDAPPETRQLFNGQDLSGFYTWLQHSGYEDPDRVFSVVDRIDGAPAIRISGQRVGALVTREEFSDYHLTAEFRWGAATWAGRKEAARDSGILVHCQGPDGSTRPDFKGPWMVSVECQIIDGGVGDLILVGGFNADGKRAETALTVAAGKDRDGEIVYDPRAEPRELKGVRINWEERDPDWKDVLGFRGQKDLESPGGEWTRLEVICDGDRITTVVNGKVVNAGTRAGLLRGKDPQTRAALTRGKVMFQSELAEIYFRKIEIRPLPRKA